MPWLDPLTPTFPTLFPEWFLNHWRNLAIITDQADPFCCAPIWNLTYHNIFTPLRRIYYNYTDNSAIIFGEYISTHGDIILAPLEESWLFGQPLLGDSAPELLYSCLSDFHSQYPGNKLTFCISGIKKNSMITRMLDRFFNPTYLFFAHSHFTQASASLVGGLDGWLSRRSSNHRAKLRKAAKKAHMAGLIFERHRPNPINAHEIYSRMLAIEERSWKGLSHNGMSDSPSREFYGYMIRSLAYSNEALVMFATLDGEDIGFIFGGIMDKWYRGQQFSYVAKSAPYSVGNLLQMEKIRWLCELNIERYDMGTCIGPRMDYKLHWTEEFCNGYTWIMRQAI